MMNLSEFSTLQKRWPKISKTIQHFKKKRAKNHQKRQKQSHRRNVKLQTHEEEDRLQPADDGMMTMIWTPQIQIWTNHWHVQHNRRIRYMIQI